MPGWSLTLMAHVRRPVSVPYPRRKNCPLLFAGWMTSVLLATGAQARASGAYSHRRQSGPQLPVARQFWQPRQRTLPRGTAAGARRHHAIPHGAPASSERALLRLDGEYGTGAVLSDLAGFVFVTRGKEYTVLDHPLVQARLHLPPDQFQQRPESQTVRSLYDCPECRWDPGDACRVMVATHPAGKKKSPVGVTRGDIVYELFFTALPQQTFTASDVVELYLHRGAFEPALSDEDQEHDPDRWCSHSAWGQECWQVVSQWVWNLRLELGHQLQPDPVRITEFAPALPPPSPHTAPASGYAPPHVGLSWKVGRFSGQDFALQPDGTLRCPADQKLSPMSSAEKPMEACASCMEPASAVAVPVRCANNVNGRAAPPPSRARSACCCIPLGVGTAPLLWRDWSRRQHRRACMQFLHGQRVDVHLETDPPHQKAASPPDAFPCAASPYGSRGLSDGLQCLCLNGCSVHDHAVRGARRFCSFARLLTA